MTTTPKNQKPTFLRKVVESYIDSLARYKEKNNIPEKWEHLLSLIPDYDCFYECGDYIFVPEKAEYVIEFIETQCSHVKGKLARQPVLLEDWQKAFIGCAFGWLTPDQESRRYTEIFFFVPRKNGKSVLCACIGNYMFFCDNEHGAEIYAAAAEKEQASLVWNMAKQQILYNEDMEKNCKIGNASRVILDETDGSFFKPISADADTKHGFNPSCVLFDELHAQKKPDLVDVLETGMGARSQPLFISLTTSDYERPSICNTKYDYATKVRDKVINDPRFLPVIYEATREDDWTDPVVWAKANPNLGVSVSLDFLKRECDKAKQSAAYQNTFKRLYLDIRTEQDIKWILLEDWDKCVGDISLDDLRGKKCYAGLDLSSVSDLTAFVMYFPEYAALWGQYYVPRETAKRRKEKNRVAYIDWAAKNHMVLTPGDAADYDLIRAEINKFGEIYDIQSIGIDRWQSNQIQHQLVGDGFEMIPFGQGFGSMSGPTKEFERKLITKDLVHFGHPVLRWCASNVSVEKDAADNMKPSKKSSAEKIDGIVAAIMALGVSMLEPEPKPSVYETRGILEI